MYGSAQLASQSGLAEVIGVDPCQDTGSWFAVQTYARHEKVVAQEISYLGLSGFLPLARQVRNWTDRRKVVELPLFSCYVFVKLVATSRERLRVLQVRGVLRFVGSQGAGIAIPDEQIESLRILVEKQLPLCSHPFLKIGQRVRIRSGALSGVEGILLSRSGERALIISLAAIERSLSVRIEGYDVEPV